MSTVIGIIVGILILSVMMILHELGHFLVGRRLGFKIEEFSVFMGPVLFSWQRQGIKYNIKLLPIGASVHFAGEFSDDGTPNDDPGNFYNRPKWARAVVISAGPLVNLLSGVLAFLIMFSAFGYTVPVLAEYDDYTGTQAQIAGIQPGEQIVAIADESIRTTLDYVGVDMFINEDKPLKLDIQSAEGTVREVTLEPATVEGYSLGLTINQNTSQITEIVPAANGGNQPLQVGDKLVKVNGTAYDYDLCVKAVNESAGSPIIITVLRNGGSLDLEVTAAQVESFNDRGIYFQTRHDFVPAIGQSFEWSWSIVKVTLRSIGMMFTGQIKAQDTLSGPVGVVTIVSDVVAQGLSLSDLIEQLLWMFALISVSLGFMNLLPIPPLDGNHLVLIILEAIRGKRLSEKAQNMVGLTGLVLIIMLAAAGLIFDVMRLINR